MREHTAAIKPPRALWVPFELGRPLGVPNDPAFQKRGRTTVGLSGFDIDALSDFIGAFLGGSIPVNPRSEIPLGQLLRFAVEDLKAFYFEAVTAQPGPTVPDGTQLADWFWDKTIAAQVLFAVKKACMHSSDEEVQIAASMFLIPLDRMQ